MLVLKVPTFVCASFFSFFCSVHPPPFPRQVSSPKSPLSGTSDSTLSRRGTAACRGWVLGTVLDEVAPQEKKEHVPCFPELQVALPLLSVAPWVSLQICTTFCDISSTWKGAKGIPTKGAQGKCIGSHEFQGSGYFQGASACFQGVFPYALSGYAL